MKIFLFIFSLVLLSVFPLILFGVFWELGFAYGGIYVHLIFSLIITSLSVLFYYYKKHDRKMNNENSGTVLLSDIQINEIIEKYLRNKKGI